IYLLISTTYYNTTFNMTTLKKTTSLRRIPQRNIAWQTNSQLPPVSPLTKSSQPSSMPSDSILEKKFLNTQEKNPQPWHHADIQQWNTVKTFIWSQWANFKNRVQDWFFQPSAIEPAIPFGQSELSMSVNASAFTALQKEALEAA